MHDGNPSGSDPYDGLTLRIERLYQRLIGLQTAPGADTGLAEVLRLLAEVMRCEVAYLEVFGTSGDTLYWLGHTTDAQTAEAVRARVSRDLAKIVITKRKTVVSSLPAAPPQRPEQTSALCSPLGGVVPVGILYVEGSTSFASDDLERMGTIARHLGNINTMIANPSRPSLGAQIRALKERLIRESLERHRGNIAEVARELSVGRTLIYRTLKRHGDVQ